MIIFIGIPLTIVCGIGSILAKKSNILLELLVFSTNLDKTVCIVPNIIFSNNLREPLLLPIIKIFLLRYKPIKIKGMENNCFYTLKFKYFVRDYVTISTSPREHPENL